MDFPLNRMSFLMSFLKFLLTTFIQTALDSGISCNIFFGDSGEHQYLNKILQPPYKEHFKFWLLNIIEQNRSYESFYNILARLPEALAHFFLKQVLIKFLQKHTEPARFKRVRGQTTIFHSEFYLY